MEMTISEARLEITEIEDNRVFCQLKGKDIYKDVFTKMTEMCQKLGTSWCVEVNYSLERNCVICDVFINWFDDKYKAKDITIDQAISLLSGLVAAKVEVENYRKKVFAEAAEIAAKLEAESFRVRMSAEDKYGDPCDYRLGFPEKEPCYHSKEIGWYVYETDGETGEIWKKEVTV